MVRKVPNDDQADGTVYSDIRYFLPVIEKAREACRNSGHEPADHFEDILEMVPIGFGAAGRT